MKARMPIMLAAPAAAGLAPTPQEQANLAGGSYTVGRGAAAGSVLDLPLASPGQFTASPIDWGPSS
jgi:hypothetical protein